MLCCVHVLYGRCGVGSVNIYVSIVVVNIVIAHVNDIVVVDQSQVVIVDEFLFAVQDQQLLPC